MLEGEGADEVGGDSTCSGVVAVVVVVGGWR